LTRLGDFAGVSNSQKDNDQFEKALILRRGTGVPMVKSVVILPQAGMDASAACEQVVRKV